MSLWGGNDGDIDFLIILKHGETIGYDADLWNCLGGFHGETNQRVYSDARECLGNYKTVFRKEEALRNIIDGDRGHFF